MAMLADTEWLRFIFFPIFTICVITAMIKMSEDIKNKAQENLFFVIACGLAGMNIVVFYLIYDILKREHTENDYLKINSKVLSLESLKIAGGTYL